MRIKAIVLSIGLLLSGCSAVVTSRDIALDFRPAKNISIGLANADTVVSPADPTGTRKKRITRRSYSTNYQNDLHNTLLSESKGVVSEFTNQPLLLSLAFRFDPQFQASALIGVPSLFLPFLAFVPESNNEVYSIDYAIRDQYGNVVHQRSLKGNVEGYIKGYFVGRIDASVKLKTMERAFAAKNAARLVLKDIEENAEKLFAAANMARSTQAFSAPRDTAAEPAAQPVAPDEDLPAYQQAKSLNTLKAYTTFLHDHPSSSNRREALAAMALLIKQQKGSYENYRKFIVEFEDGMEFVPSQHRLALIGPEGMRVHDILRLLRQGVEDKVIAAKIRMQNALYKDFDFEEIGALNKMGITGVLIEAMLDSTTRAKRSQDELRKKKEMEDLLSEIQQTQRKLDAMKAGQGQQQQQPPAAASGQQESGPSVGETVKNCAAQIAALEACKHLPWPASTLCAATAKSQFPCQ